MEKEVTTKGKYIYKQFGKVCLYIIANGNIVYYRLEDLGKEYGSIIIENDIVDFNEALNCFYKYCLHKGDK